MNTRRFIVPTFSVSVAMLTIFLSMGSILDSVDNAAAQTTDAENVELVGHIGGSASCVLVEGDYAFAGVGPELVVMDVTDPAHPTRHSYIVLPDTVQHVSIASGYAYVADQESGLRVVDISNPSAPVEVGFYDTPGSASGVAVADDYAYIADYYNGLRVVDISEPSAPREVGSYDTLGQASSIAVVGNYAYIADGMEGMRVIDVSNPVNPSEVGFHNTPGWSYDIAVEGNYAYMADGETGLQIVDISIPAAPVPIGAFDTPGYANGVTVANLYVYVTDGSEGVRLINVSNPTSPSDVGVYNTPGYAQSVAVSGNYTYIADGSGGLRVIDFSNPATAIEVGAYEAPTDAWGVAATEDYVYIADGRAGLRIVDISNPTSPIQAGTWDTPGHAYGVAVSGNYAYVADYEGGLRIVDISEPSAPQEIGFYDMPETVRGVAVFDNYAYVADYDSGLRVVDISNPSAPIEVGLYDTPGSAISVAIAGNHAYVADGYSDVPHGWYGGLRIVDITDPTAPFGVGYHDLGGGTAAYDVAIAGDFAYVADWIGMRIINIDNPATPFEVGAYDMPSSTGSGVAVSEEYAYIAGGYNGGLEVVDVSDPAAPEGAGFFYTLDFAEDVAVSNGYAYIANNDMGLYVLRYTGATPPDLSVVSVEAVQVLEGQDLVKDKSTAVKVVVRKTGARAADNVGVQLNYESMNYVEFYVAEPDNMGSYYELIEDDSSYELDFGFGEITKTIYFFGDSLKPSGSTFQASVTIDHFNRIPETDETNNTLTSQLSPVYDVRWGSVFPNLRIHYFRLDWDNTSSPDYYTNFCEYTNEFFGSVYPVSKNRFDHEEFLFHDSTAIYRGFDDKLNALELLHWWMDTLALYKALQPHVDRFAFIVPVDWFSNTTKGKMSGYAGISNPLLPSLVIAEARRTVRPNGPSTVSHELGHTYGLPTGLPQGCREESDSCNPSIQDGIGNYASSGLWVDKKIPVQVSANREVYSLMGGYANVEYWVKSGDYAKLLEGREFLESIDTIPSSPITSNATKQAILAIGKFHTTGTLTLGDWYVLPEADIDTLATGQYTFEYQDADGGVLYEHSFDVSFDFAGTALSEAPIVVTIPFIPSTARVVVKKNGIPLGEKTVSPNAPTVTLIVPNGGERLSQKTEIRWSSSDLDSDELSYVVAFRPEGGENWRPIAGGLTETSYEWNTAGLTAGTQYLIKVIATDGFNIGEDVSDAPFEIAETNIYLPIILKNY